MPDPPAPDLQFPQMENPELAAPGRHPRLLDYVYVSFTNAIAFSPAGTPTYISRSVTAPTSRS